MWLFGLSVCALWQIWIAGCEAWLSLLPGTRLPANGNVVDLNAYRRRLKGGAR